MTEQNKEANKELGAVSATAVDTVSCSVPADQLSHDAIMPERSLAGTATMKNRSAGARDASRSELTDSGSRYRPYDPLEHDAIHNWFELTYAQYLTIPRSVLQSMPDEWQTRFVRCLNELDDMIDWRPKDGCYRVELRALRDKREDGQWVSGWGRVLSDPLRDYERGRRRLPLRVGSGNESAQAERAVTTRRSAAQKD